MSSQYYGGSLLVWIHFACAQPDRMIRITLLGAKTIHVHEVCMQSANPLRELTSPGGCAALHCREDNHYSSFCVDQISGDFETFRPLTLLYFSISVGLRLSSTRIGERIRDVVPVGSQCQY
jgi:hypothetical protein